MRQGAFDFLQKPFRPQELLDRVRKALASNF
jgi:FixJ family two-component response regulator